MLRFQNARGRLLGLLLLLWIVINGIVRTVLLFMAHHLQQAEFRPADIASIYLKGAVNDLFPYFLITLPFVLFVLLKKNLWGGRTGRAITSAVFWMYACLFIFGSIAETLFWEEYGSRFNFIAVDYLIYTTEVTKNIAESYPLIPLLSAMAGSATILCFMLLRPFWKHACLPAARSELLLAVCVAMAGACLWYSPLTSGSRIERELSANGIWSLFSAYRNNELDYREFYPTIDEKKAAELLHEELEKDGSTFISQDPAEWRRTIESENAEWKPNVIQIVVESLGSDKIGPHTPNLNAIISNGMSFSRLMATGTRTVRGIEALMLSLPPTPGSSIVRRPDCAGMFSAGSVFRSKGYDTAFIYGGYGYFDNMNAFFSGNGFRIVDRSSLPSEAITFSNAWGVCDEDLFNAALRDAESASLKGRPFYQFILTTSNHRPFTYPEGKISIPSGTGRTGAVAYTDYAIGEFFRKASEKPWFKNTVFVISGDHTSGAAGHTDLPPERYRIPAVIYCPEKIPPMQSDILCSQADIAPTLFDVLGWTYRSGFFGRSILKMKKEDGRAWISTYQLLGRLTNTSLTVLSPRLPPAVYPWKLDSPEQENTLITSTEALPFSEQAIAEYQQAHDLFKAKKLKESLLQQ